MPTDARGWGQRRQFREQSRASARQSRGDSVDEGRVPHAVLPVHQAHARAVAPVYGRVRIGGHHAGQERRDEVRPGRPGVGFGVALRDVPQDGARKAKGGIRSGDGCDAPRILRATSGSPPLRSRSANSSRWARDRRRVPGLRGNSDRAGAWLGSPEAVPDAAHAPAPARPRSPIARRPSAATSICPCCWAEKLTAATRDRIPAPRSENRRSRAARKRLTGWSASPGSRGGRTGVGPVEAETREPRIVPVSDAGSA